MPDVAPDIAAVFNDRPLTRTAQTRFLHVANGTSTTMTIEAAGIPGTYSIWADELYGGPVPGGLSDAELIDARARHLAGWADSDPANQLEQWRMAIERHDSYDELILWFEHDLFDQLNLIHLLTWIHERLPQEKPVTLICIGSFPGRPDFKGLGELTPGELASLLETRQPVSPAQYALAERAWRAFREPTPEAIETLRHDDTSALPYLAEAVTRFLQDYPWTTDGLSRTERRLLELSGGEGIALSKAFPRMGDGERSFHITDRVLITLVASLSRTSPPLLTLDPAGAAPDNVLQGVVTLTVTGRSVLAGELDRVATCGIDRWFGGVHLHGRGKIWRWDPARQRVIQA
jgi:hypothetical protein